MTTPTQPDSREYYSPQDVADRYQIPLATVYEWRKHKKKSPFLQGPPFRRMGKHLRISAAALADWERENNYTT